MSVHVLGIRLGQYTNRRQVISLRDIFGSPRDDMSEPFPASCFIYDSGTDLHRYLVTDLMSTDLSQIIAVKPIEDEFIKYIFYQIMVRD
jgi:hypothetical protein